MTRAYAQQHIKEVDICVVGAGITGLTTAFLLNKKGKRAHIVERADRVGGQIHTFNLEGFTFESGPNTGALSFPEVAELFNIIEDDNCKIQTACNAAKCRLIWKGSDFHKLPQGIISGMLTPLFSIKDKFRILAEPLRPKGTNPNESVAQLATRRLGKSFLNYAVDPFISGIYAGDPTALVTRYALPKLYNLEQQYGSFIRGAIAKARQTKTKREKLATKQVFSVNGGFSTLTNCLAGLIGQDNITLNADKVQIKPCGKAFYTTFTNAHGIQQTILSKMVVTTSGAYSLPSILPFADKQLIKSVSNLYYAPIVQVAVGFNNMPNADLYRAFGALVPTCEQKNVLGILYPSSCFAHRCPEGGMLFSFFLGGIRHPEYIDKSDDEIKLIVNQALHNILKIKMDIYPKLIKIFRHKRAIPQYDVTTGERLNAIDKIEKTYPGLILAGNIKDGIGMAHRIKQATDVAERCMHHS